MAKTVITCAITGNLTRPEQTPHLPITPEQIAESAIGAAEAGAAVVHIHVRDPETGRPSMELGHYREVVERIRAKDDEVVLNLTTGPGGRYHPSEDDPAKAGPRTTLRRPELRCEHVRVLRPEVCTVDLNTMTFGAEVVINTPESVRRIMEIAYAAGSLPEFELFDSGDAQLLQVLIDEGAVRQPVMCSLVLGIRYGFPATPASMAFACSLLPQGVFWTGFGVGRMSFPMVAQSVLLGGHVRVGLEDTVRLSREDLAPSNAALVAKARRIIEDLGGTIAPAAEAREMLKL